MADQSIQLWERTNTPYPDFVPLETGNGLAPATDYIGQAVKKAGTIFGTYGGPTDEPVFGSDGEFGNSQTGSSADPFGKIGNAVSGAVGLFNIVTDPVRVITVVVGLIFIMGGLYLLKSPAVVALKKAVA